MQNLQKKPFANIVSIYLKTLLFAPSPNHKKILTLIRVANIKLVFTLAFFYGRYESASFIYVTLIPHFDSRNSVREILYDTSIRIYLIDYSQIHIFHFRLNLYLRLHPSQH